MRKARILFLVLFFFLCMTRQSFAHLAGMPPYFRINGKYTNLYHIQSTSVDELVIPQDDAPDNYLVNQEINFDMDLTQLPFPPEIVKKTKFTWDFGDGTSGTGLQNTHTYTKMGTYMIRITTDQGVGDFETVRLNILPDKNYQLPKAAMTINGFIMDEVVSAPLEIKPSDMLSFDSAPSTASSSSIVEYFWDFGDRGTSKEKSATHQFDPKYHLVFPLLHIKDANGFIADAFTTVSIDDKNKGAPSPVPLTQQKTSSSGGATSNPKWIFIEIGLVAAFFVIALFVRPKK